jgi:hypothetical protein
LKEKKKEHEDEHCDWFNEYVPKLTKKWNDFDVDSN